MSCLRGGQGGRAFSARVRALACAACAAQGGKARMPIQAWCKTHAASGCLRPRHCFKLRGTAAHPAHQHALPQTTGMTHRPRTNEIVEDLGDAPHIAQHVWQIAGHLHAELHAPLGLHAAAQCGAARTPRGCSAGRARARRGSKQRHWPQKHMSGDHMVVAPAS